MHSIAVILLFILSSLCLTACASNAHYDADRAHHTESGFRNIDYQDDKGLGAFLKWQWQRLFKESPADREYHFELDRSQHALLKDNHEKPSLTWLGHATFLLQFRGLNILTDPHLTERASPFSWIGPKRQVPVPIEMQQLPAIDVLLISHDHYDALDSGTIELLLAHNQLQLLTIIVPLGLKDWFSRQDFEAPAEALAQLEVIELDWQQSVTLKGVTFTAEPSQHWSKRSLFDAYERLWASWVISAAQQRVFFAGDTGYADHFRQLGERYNGFNLALLPIGAYEPRWFMRGYHVNPQEAVQMHQDLRARYSVAMHWGTFILTDEPLDEPPRKLREALIEAKLPLTEFEVYKHGETRWLDGRYGF
jgi:L-ascorbate metabolism protein UlaG (beta-lactamase superfamily)